MKPKAKKLWISALRSGCYKQICGLMRNTKTIEVGDFGDEVEEIPNMSPKNSSMCVMGVLAEIALRESGLKYNLQNWMKFSEDNERPTERLRNWAGLTEDEVTELIDQNDGMSSERGRTQALTFKEFANYIEEKF